MRARLPLLARVADGKTNREIAQLFFVSPHTVRKHLENIFDKLGVHTRWAAVARRCGPELPGVAAVPGAGNTT